jgi:hypothetical protein
MARSRFGSAEFRRHTTTVVIHPAKTLTDRASSMISCLKPTEISRRSPMRPKSYLRLFLDCEQVIFWTSRSAEPLHRPNIRAEPRPGTPYRPTIRFSLIERAVRMLTTTRILPGVQWKRMLLPPEMRRWSLFVRRSSWLVASLQTDTPRLTISQSHRLQHLSRMRHCKPVVTRGTDTSHPDLQSGHRKNSR